MKILLIKNEQDLIFKSKTSLLSEKKRKKQLNNKFTSNSVISESDANHKVFNFINLYY